MTDPGWLLFAYCNGTSSFSTIRVPLKVLHSYSQHALATNQLLKWPIQIMQVMQTLQCSLSVHAKPVTYHQWSMEAQCKKSHPHSMQYIQCPRYTSHMTETHNSESFVIYHLLIVNKTHILLTDKQNRYLFFSCFFPLLILWKLWNLILN